VIRPVIRGILLTFQRRKDASEIIADREGPGYLSVSSKMWKRTIAAARTATCATTVERETVSAFGRWREGEFLSLAKGTLRGRRQGINLRILIAIIDIVR